MVAFSRILCNVDAVCWLCWGDDCGCRRIQLYRVWKIERMLWGELSMLKAVVEVYNMVKEHTTRRERGKLRNVSQPC